MSCVIKAYYNVEEGENFISEFKQILKDVCHCDCACNSDNKSGVNQTVDRIPLYNDCSCKRIGTIQFNSIEYNKKRCHDNLYNITENISIQFDDCNETQIFAENFYRSNTNYYKDHSKYTIKIISCTGDLVEKTGYIVIDVVGNKRYVYIKFD